MFFISRTTVYIFIAIAIVGCIFTKPEEDLAEKWSSQFEQYGFTAVFPPREDIAVGDLYVSCSSLMAGIGGPPRVFIGPIDKNIKVKLSNYYKSRVVIPATSFPATPPVKDKNEEGDGVVRIPALPSASDLFTSTTGDTSRLRSVSLPEFFSVTASGFSGGISLPAGISMIGLGLGKEDFSSVSLSVMRAESYGLPYAEFDSALFNKSTNRGWDQAVSYFKFVEAQKRSALTNKTDDPTNCVQPGIVLITEVYVARTLDIAYTFSQKGAAKFRVALQNPVDTTTRGKALKALGKWFGIDDDVGGAESSGVPNTAQSQQPKPTPDQTLSFMNDLKDFTKSMEDMYKLGFVGVDGGYYTGSENGFSVHREFVNPVVIGYRGVLVDPDTGTPVGGSGRRPLFR